MEHLRASLPGGGLDLLAIERAAGLLREGGLVAIPTETVYGLGANALDAASVRRVFDAKGRPSFNPLIVHVPTLDAARGLVRQWPPVATLLARHFWPGPLTLVLPRAACIPDVVTGGIDSVAVRVPSHPVTRKLLELAGVPVAAPSANPSGAISPTRAEHVLKGLEGRIDAVLDAGPCEVGIESTVLDLTGARPRLLRPGGVSISRLAAMIGAIDEGPEALDEGPRASPGLLSKHYAPQGETRLVETEAIAAALASLPAAARVGVLTRTRPRASHDDARITTWLALGDDPAAFARDLYDGLHRMDDTRCTHVLLERVPSSPEWRAVLDRLTRAAG